MKILNGAFCATVTPMTKDGERILPENIGPLFHYFSTSGLDGILLLGSTGEGASLSLEEKKVLIDEASSCRGGLKLILGCITTSMSELMELVQLGKKKNATALLIPPPFYYKSVTEEGIEKYFEYVLERSEVPILLYNIPSNTGISLSRGMLERLSRFDTLYGIKESSGKIQETSKYLLTKPKRILLGSDMNLLRGLELGVEGIISACANVVPELVVNIRKGYLSGKEVTILQKRLSEVRKALGQIPFLAGLKRWMKFRDIEVGGIRLPYYSLTKEEQGKILLIASKYNINSELHTSF